MTLETRQPREHETSDVSPIAVIHRRYVTYADSHYAGGLVNGAFVLGLFGDVATELSIRTDGDEGLLASYSDIQFTAPIRAGDVIETEATLLEFGRRSRRIRFEARVVCRGAPERGASAATVLARPLLVSTAEGTVVVPAGRVDGSTDGPAVGAP